MSYSYQPVQRDAADSHLDPPAPDYYRSGSAGVATTAVTHTQSLPAEPTLRPSRCASGTLFGFAVVCIVLSIIMLALNVVPAGKRVEVYVVNNAGRYGSISSITREHLFVPGIWLGVLELIAATLALIYGLKASRASCTIDRKCCAPVFCTGWFLSVVFALMSVVAAVAGVLAIIVKLDVLFITTFHQCTDGYIRGVTVCGCVSGDTVYGGFRNADCAFATGTLPNLYAAVAVICGLVSVLNIVISALFCGALCCCSTYTLPDAVAMSSMVVVSSAPALAPDAPITAHVAAPVVAAEPVTAYAYDPAAAPVAAPAMAYAYDATAAVAPNPPQFQKDTEPMLANPI
ncbi:uncharacterized protein LOC135812211 isoform X2 [Sycon ciliatum]|uniref:uncharacterized protein LOC135812211 isoform X1 n=1 Tax=Sycon ciliatum TaxID=27933 RepID=UPI0031F67604